MMLFSACQKDTAESSVFRSLDPNTTGVDFSNDLPLDINLNILNYMYYYNGGGLALADLNNDGLIDIILSSNLGPEKTYLNKGNLNFEDVSEELGIDGGPHSWTNGVAVADVNNDGLNDVYLSQVGDYKTLDSNNKLFMCTGIENGVPQYEEQAEKWNIDFKGLSTQAGFFDYDLDGDLDMYLMNHSLHHNGTFGQRKSFLNTYDTISGDRLFRNEGDHFTDVTKESGINSSVIGYGLGLAFSDINLDGYPDIYIGNDFHENDYLYINQKNGRFKDVLTEQMMHTSRFSMGVDVADINGDVFPDIVSLDMLPEDASILKSSEGEDALDIFKFKLGYGYNHQYAKNALQLNTGRSSFKEIASMAGVHATDWSWSPLIFDMDMDGNNDLFISNGIPKRMNDIDYINFISNSDIQYKIQFEQLTEKDLEVINRIPEIKLLNKFYFNTGELSFKDLSSNVQNAEISYSNSAAYADLDNDGDYDLVCNNINEKAYIYENVSEAKGIAIETAMESVPSQYIAGVKFLLYQNGQARLLEQYSARGFQACSQSKMIVPQQIKYDSILVIWPDSRYSKLHQLNSDTLIKRSVSENLQKFDYNSLKINAEFAVGEVSEEFKLNFTHKENPFVEFNRESLIPHSNSSEGPALTVADFNADGLDDVFVGSSKRRYNALFLQSANGQFFNIGDIGIDSTYEEVESLALDLDGNAYLDLVVATGGNEFGYNNDYTKPLIIFDVATEQARVQALDINLTASSLCAADIDNDNDLDLFFGARSMVSSYGGEVESYVLINKGQGQFVKDDSKWVEAFQGLGMVKDAVFDDYDSNGFQDLIVAEEWGGIHLFANDGSGFEKKQLVSHKAWWNFIELLDIDDDGDLDILAGNLGRNTRLQASKKNPVRMYYNDFDDNGSFEQILTYYVGGREVPFSNYKEIVTQIPKLKKKYLYASDFANADIIEIFGSEKIISAKKYEIDFIESAIFINNGDDGFETLSLPLDVQMSSMKTAVIDDFDQDGLSDIFLAGNYYDCNIQMGRYDANYGTLLINKASDGYKSAQLSGHLIKDQVRNSELIEIAGEAYIVLAKNDNKLELIKIDNQQ